MTIQFIRCLLLGTMLSSSAYAADFKYDTAKRAVVTIYCESSRSFGGGVIVSRSTIVSMVHVIDKCTQQVLVGFYDGTGAVGTVAATDPANDLAIIRPNRIPDFVTIADLEVSTPALDDKLHFIAHPNGIEWTYSEAHMAYPSERNLDLNGRQFSVLTVTTLGYSGASGGALFDANGRVVGFAEGMLIGTSLTFFIPSGAVCKKILKCKVN